MTHADPPVLLPLLPAPQAGRVWIALSGGMDSMVLLHRLAHEPPLRETGLHAIHVHHGLHADADAWTRHCEAACEALGIPVQVARVEVDRNSGQGLEAAARHARHAAFAACLQPGDILATAHHQDDQAETFLLRALRASGPDGLSAMRPWRAFDTGWQWRPLLQTPRADLMAYARAHALAWCEDPSNRQVEFDRNFLRHQLLPVLRQRWPHADEALARSAALCGEATDLLAAEDAMAMAQARTLDPAALHVDALARLTPPRRARVLRRWVDSNDLPALPAEGVRRIETDLLPASADASAAFAWQGVVIRRWRGLLHVERQRDALPESWQVEWSGERVLALPDGGRLSLEGNQRLASPLRVAARRGGERIVLPGRSHSHALKDVLQAQGIPPWERRQLPLLWSGGTLWAAGDLVLSGACDDWLRTHDMHLHWRRG